MQYVADWATGGQAVLLNFSEGVLDVFRAYVQTRGRPESGGVLLGTVHKGGILITTATPPSRHDGRHPYLFERGPNGHRAAALRQWRRSSGTVRYLGEWHTHPQDWPNPSHIDRDEWRQLARARLDRRPLLAVIVGRMGLHVEFAAADGLRELLAPV